MINFRNLIMMGAIITLFAACKDDDVDPALMSEFNITIENVVTPNPHFQSSMFAVPIGKADPAPLFPGDAYEFTFNAGPHVTPMDGGTRLSFATMFVQSNDLFLAPDVSGIELFGETGTPIGGGGVIDVTDQVLLWDAGTEVNTITGSDDQKPQQEPTAEDIGTDENGVVSEIMNNTDGINIYPNVEDVMRLTIQYMTGGTFKVRMENVSNGTTILTPAQGVGTTAAVPLSPGVWVIHTADGALFTSGQAASQGIEDIAEDGVITAAVADVTSKTGLIVPLSPGVWAVHNSTTNPLFNNGAPDLGEGLEAIAEDGVPTGSAITLAAKDGVLSSDLFNTPDGASGPGAIGPGGLYSFTFTASQGDRLSLATMFVQSNDWIYTFPENGIALFNGNTPISGDITSSLLLFDVGTEADEFPGAGLNQVIRQSSADAGPADANTNVRQVSNPPANVPANNQVIKVTITPK